MDELDSRDTETVRVTLVLAIPLDDLRALLCVLEEHGCDRYPAARRWIGIMHRRIDRNNRGEP